MINIFIILALVLGAFIPLYVLKDKLNKEKLILTTKILAIVLFSLGVFRNFLNDNFVWVINGGRYGGIYYKTKDVLQSLLRWGMMLSFIVYPCAIYFKHRVLKNFAIYFCLPVTVLCTIFYGDFMNYFVTDSGRAIYVKEWFRHIEFTLELAIMMFIPLVFRFLLGHKFNVKDKQEWINFFGLLPLALLVVIPVTLPQSIFGFSTMFMKPMSIQNIGWVLVIIGLFAGLYFGYRFKDRETRFMICVFLALYLFMHYNSIYLMDLNMSRMPFQLCNLGSYLILIALLIKKQGFFNFILMANVAGALIAVFVPDISEGMLSYWNIHFYIEHTWVLVLPLLIVSLRIFDRPAKGSIKHFLIGFSCYFVFCAVAGILINCLLYQENHQFFNDVNYFYLFDDTVVKILFFFVFTRYVPVTWSGYTFYPFYMLLVYVLYIIYCFAIYFVYREACKLGDDHFKMRGIRIDLFKDRGYYKKRKRLPKKDYLD